MDNKRDVNPNSGWTGRWKSWIRKPWFRRTLWGAGAALLLFFLVLNVAIWLMDVSALDKATPQPTLIYDRNGKVASKISASQSEGVKINQVPKHMIQAVVAIEDQRFYHHSGVDYVGTLRAAVTNLQAGSVVQGGSTLTQQLAKNVFLTHDRTYKRKIKEFLYAKKIERTYSKDQIMEHYLNTIYFGEGAWGVQKAAQTYFGKDAKDLNLGEAATLAGMIKAPSALSPFKHFNKAMERRNVVLDKMEEQGFISSQELARAKSTDVVLQGKKLDEYKGRYPSYVDAIIQEAIDRYNLTENEVLSGGLRIYTELDPRMQESAERVYRNSAYFPQSPDDQQVQSGTVLLDPATGGIRALVGGRGEHVFRGFNHATQLKRQPGSTMKPLSVYTPALEKGYTIASRLKDEPMSFGNYRPTNYDGRYRGDVTMYEAVIHSANIPAVWLLDRIGVEQGANAVERFGIPLKQEDKSLGLALGGMNQGTSPLQMAQAYSVFPNNGVMADAHTIKRIENVDGENMGKWYKKSIRVTSRKVAQHITYMLRGVVQEGTGRQAQLPGRPTAGKTGTTQVPGQASGAKDNWFVGYTPQLVGAVWLGYDKTDARHYLTTSSGSTAGPIFREIMSEALKGQPVKAFDLSMVKYKKPPKVEEEKKKEKESDKLRKELEKEWNKRKKRLKDALKKKAKEWREKLEQW
jgi:penicillin-binding protein 2A